MTINIDDICNVTAKDYGENYSLITFALPLMNIDANHMLSRNLSDLPHYFYGGDPKNYVQVGVGPDKIKLDFKFDESVKRRIHIWVNVLKVCLMLS